MSVKLTKQFCVSSLMSIVELCLSNCIFIVNELVCSHKILVIVSRDNLPNMSKVFCEYLFVYLINCVRKLIANCFLIFMSMLTELGL